MTVIRNFCTPCDDAAFYNQVTIAGDAPVISASTAPAGGSHPTLAPQVVVNQYDDITRMFVSNDGAAWSHIDINYNSALSVANLAALPEADEATHESYHIRTNRMVYDKVVSSVYTADFNVLNNYVDFGFPLIHPTADFDISFEFKPDIVSQQEYIFSQYTFGEPGRFVFQQVADNRLLLFVENSISNIELYSTSTISTGNWYNIRIARTGDKFDIYFNGALEGSSIRQNVEIDQTENTTLGTTYNSANDFNGKIRNVSITSNNVTTEYLTETIDLPGATLSGATSALERFERLVPTRLSYCNNDTEWSNMSEMVDGQVLYHRGRSAAYIYNEESSSWSTYGGASLSSSKTIPEVSVERTALYLDSRAGEKYVANYDGKSWLLDQSRNGSLRKMRSKYTLSPNGSSESAITENEVTVVGDGTRYTLMAWAKTSSSLTSRYVCGQWDSVGSNRIAAISISNGIARFFVSADGTTTNFLDLQTTQTYNDGEWHHYALTFDNGILNGYVDGIEVPDSVIVNGTVNIINTLPAVFGAGGQASGLTNTFNGDIDDVRAFDVVLSSEEIAKISKSSAGSLQGLSSKDQPLIWYDFEGDPSLHLVRNKGSLGPLGNAICSSATFRESIGHHSFANEIGFSETTPTFNFAGPTAWHGSYASTYQFEGPFRVDMVWLNVSHGEDHIGFTDLNVNSAFQTSVYNHARQIGIRITPSTAFAYINAGSALASIGVASGDIMSIERDENNIVHFRKNGVDWYTSSAQTGTFRFVYANYGSRSSYPVSLSENGIRLTNDQIDMFAFGSAKELLNGENPNTTEVVQADPARPFTHDAEGLGGLQHTGQAPHSALLNTPVPSLNGTTDSYNFGTLDLEIQDEITCSCWIKTTEVGTEGLFGSWLGPGDFRSFLMFLQNGDFGMSISSDGTYTASTVIQVAAEEDTAIVNDGVWHHVLAMVKTNDGFPKLYVDGKLAAPTQSASTATELSTFQSTTIADFEIGRYNQTDTTCVDAELADVRVYNRVLTQEEINTLANGIDVRDESLKLHVPMTGDSDELLLSTVGGHIGIGTPTARAGSIDTYDTLVRDGYSIGTWYDEVNDTYESPTLGTVGGTKICISVYIIADAIGVGGSQTIASEYNITGDDRSWILLFDGAGKIAFYASEDGLLPDAVVTTDAVIQADVLHHVLVTYDAGTVVIELDGIILSTVGSTDTSYQYNGAEFRIGSNDATNIRMGGIISQLLIHKHPIVVWNEETKAAIRNTGKSSEIAKALSDLGGTAWYFPDGNGNEALQGINMVEAGAPEQRIFPAGTLPITYGPGVLAPGQSIDVYNNAPNSPYAVRLDSTLTNGTYVQGDDKEDSILYVRTDETGDDRISVFDEALSGNDDSAIREDTR